MSGFSVITAKSPIEAMSLTSEPIFGKIDVAVIDYHMALMNGCILAEYLKARYPEIKIVLYSGAFDISEEEIGSVDVFISMSEGIARLIGKVVEFAQVDPANIVLLPVVNHAWMRSANWFC